MCVCVLQKDKVSDDYALKDPEHKTIYRFIRTLFNTAQLTAECAIVMLVSWPYFFITRYCQDHIHKIVRS